MRNNSIFVRNNSDTKNNEVGYQRDFRRWKKNKRKYGYS